MRAWCDDAGYREIECRDAGEPFARTPLRPRRHRVMGRSQLSTVDADSEGMSGIVDDRMLERWATSRRHQDEARRFLSRQRLSDPRGERRALEEIVGTIVDLERTLHDGAARLQPSPPPT